MESQGALKLRWSKQEVKMLVEEWAEVCKTQGTGTLRAEQLNEIIFDRYNARCVRVRELRRSPAAVSTQRDRMLHFAIFVVEFDRTELAQGRRSWYQLSEDEQLQVFIPNEWGRQRTTFTPQVFETFKRVILPTATAGGSKRKKNKKTKWGSKRVKVSAQPTVKREQGVVPVEPHPCWTPQEEALLADRWGRFMQYKALTLRAFEEMAYNQSCQRLASSTRPSVAAWRKTRALLTSWRFISSFNTQHHPGWFERSETERDQLIKWGELPNTFEDIERNVFLAMDEAVRKCVKSEPIKPEAPPLAPLPVPLEPAPVLPRLCATKERHSPAKTDDTLDLLLLEDDEAGDLQPEVCVLETLDGSTLLHVTPTLVDGHVRLEADAAVVRDTRSQPPPGRAVDPTAQILEAKLDTHMSRMRGVLGDLQNNVAKEAQDIQELVRTSRHSLAKHMELVVDNHNTRLVSTLHLAEEMCRHSETELRSLMQVCFSSDHVATPAELELY
jgi:hypothetical protein